MEKCISVSNGDEYDVFDEVYAAVDFAESLYSDFRNKIGATGAVEDAKASDEMFLLSSWLDIALKMGSYAKYEIGNVSIELL